MTHRPPRGDVPDPPVKMPKMPKNLDDEAKKEWRRLGRLLMNVKIISELDRSILAAHCDAFSRWYQASMKVKEMGMVYADGAEYYPDGKIKKPGVPRINPYMRIAREAWDQLLRSGELLGGSPSSREKINVPTTKPKSKVQQFRDRKTGGEK